MKRNRPSSGWAGRLLLAMIVLYISLFSFLACLRYASFSFDDMDLAAVNQTFFNAARGVWVSRQLGERALFSGHRWLVIALLLPLYSLFPGPPILLVLQSVALGLGALPLYLLARDTLGRKWGLLFAFCYLIYPALQWANLFEFHPIALATPLLLGAFYALHKRKWGLYLLFVVLSLSCREDAALPVFALGLFLIVTGLGKRGGERRVHWRWGALTLALSALWFLLVSRLLYIPLTSEEDASEGLNLFYGWLGETPGEILKTLLLRPGKVLAGILTRDKVRYVFRLLAPLGFTSLLSPAAFLMVLVALAEGLLSDRFTHYSIHYQYTAIITPFVFASAVLGVRNLMRWRVAAKGAKALMLVLLLSSLLSARFLGPLFELPALLEKWRVTEEDRVRDALVKEVPPEAPVVATFAFTHRLSMRPRFFYSFQLISPQDGWTQYTTYVRETSRYALIDFNDWRSFYDFALKPEERRVHRFLHDGNWELLETVNNLALFRKGESPRIGLVGEADIEEIDRPRNRPATPQVDFLGYGLRQGEVLGNRVLETTIYFQILEEIPVDLLLAAEFRSRQDPRFSFEEKFFAPYRIWPTSQWRKGAIMKETCNILIPEDAPGGAYDLILSVAIERARNKYEMKTFYREPNAVRIEPEAGRGGISKGIGWDFASGEELRGWIVDGVESSVLRNGVLRLSGKSELQLAFPPGLDLKPERNRYLKIRARAHTPRTLHVLWKPPERESGHASASLRLPPDREFHTHWLNLGKSGDWRGRIEQAVLAFRGVPGAVEIDSIEIVPFSLKGSLASGWRDFGEPRHLHLGSINFLSSPSLFGFRFIRWLNLLAAAVCIIGALLYLMGPRKGRVAAGTGLALLSLWILYDLRETYAQLKTAETIHTLHVKPPPGKKALPALGGFGNFVDLCRAAIPEGEQVRFHADPMWPWDCRLHYFLYPRRIRSETWNNAIEGRAAPYHVVYRYPAVLYDPESRRLVKRGPEGEETLSEPGRVVAAEGPNAFIFREDAFPEEGP